VRDEETAEPGAAKMTTTADRILKALETWEADRKAEGYAKCECCGNWSRGECEACEEIRPVVTLAMIIGAAMTI
jgi:hypothetical protein